MKAVEIKDLPRFSHGGIIDVACLYTGQYQDPTIHYLAYEIGENLYVHSRKEILEFGILKFTAIRTNTFVVNTLEQYECFDYDESGINEEYGFFLLEESDYINQPDCYHFHMAYCESAFDVICAEFSLVSIEKAKTASNALIQYLTSKM
jgi:hypothetical protein